MGQAPAVYHPLQHLHDKVVGGGSTWSDGGKDKWARLWVMLSPSYRLGTSNPLATPGRCGGPGCSMHTNLSRQTLDEIIVHAGGMKRKSKPILLFLVVLQVG